MTEGFQTGSEPVGAVDFSGQFAVEGTTTMMRELPPGARLEDTSISARGCGRKGLASWPCVCWRCHKRRVLACRRRWSLGSASTGLAGAGGRSRDRRASRRWMDQYPYRVGWSRGCNESERSDGPSARRLRYSRDVVFNALGAWTSRLPGRPNSPIQNEQRGTNSRRQDQSVPPFKDGCRLIVRLRRPCFAMAKDATWTLQI